MVTNHVEGFSTCRQREKSVLLPPPLLLPGLNAGAAGAFTSTRFCCFFSGTVNPPLIGPVDWRPPIESEFGIISAAIATPWCPEPAVTSSTATSKLTTSKSLVANLRSEGSCAEAKRFLHSLPASPIVATIAHSSPSGVTHEAHATPAHALEPS